MKKKKRHHAEYREHHDGKHDKMLLGEAGFANLPAQTVMKMYPATHDDNWYSDFDTPTGVDRQMAEDSEGAKRQKKHRKY
jgi:hypothetical protein